MYRRTQTLLERLGIDLDPEMRVGELSVASRQMVEIAKAVSYDSDVLIMDEPTSALTEREVEHLFRIIRDLRERGIGIVYITHKMNELFEIADEFSVFRDGKYIGTHASTDVTRDDIIRMMVGREITQMFPKEEVPIGDVVLSVKNLTLNGVFHDVSFDVRAGEILGVAGSCRFWPLERCGNGVRRYAGVFGHCGNQRQACVDRKSDRGDPSPHGVPDGRPQGYRLPADPQYS